MTLDNRTLSTLAAIGVGGALLVGVAVLSTMDTTERLDVAVPDVGVRDLDQSPIDLHHGDWIVNVWLPG